MDGGMLIMRGAGGVLLEVGLDILECFEVVLG